MLFYIKIISNKCNLNRENKYFVSNNYLHSSSLTIYFSSFAIFLYILDITGFQIYKDIITGNVFIIYWKTILLWMHIEHIGSL